MTIDSDFPKSHKVMGKHRYSDNEHHHFVCGPGRKEAETFTNTLVQNTYNVRNEEQVPLGIHRTRVAVDWDSCYADGACIEVCPVHVFQWYRTANDVPAIEMVNAKSGDNGVSNDRDGHKGYLNKSDPIREHNCIWHKVCVSVCPPQAIRVDQSNLEHNERGSRTCNVSLSKDSTLPPSSH